MKVLVLLSALIGSTAFAKTIYNPTSQKALVLSAQDDKVIADVCEKVSEDEVRKPTEETLKSKCTRLPALDAALTERNVGKAKEEALKDLEKQKAVLLDQIKAVGGNMNTKDMEAMVDLTLSQLKSSIDAITGPKYFEALQVEARTPGVTIEEKASDLDDSISAIVILTTP